MACAAAPDFAFYEGSYGGRASAEAFADALPRAAARLSALAPGPVPERFEDAWRMACCAIVDRVAGVDRRGVVASESVGSTSVSYSAAFQSPVSDADAARPYLAGTGLMCSVVASRRRP